MGVVLENKRNEEERGRRRVGEQTSREEDKVVGKTRGRRRESKRKTRMKEDKERSRQGEDK